MSRWLAIAVLCTGALAGSGQVASAQNAQADPGRIIADTVLAAGDGRPIRLGDYRGKVVFVDFWGAWCAPCVSEAASLKQLQQSLGNRADALAFLFVSIKDDHFEADTAWLKSSGLRGENYRWLNRTGEQFHVFFNISTSKWFAPNTVILDANGNIAKWVRGSWTDWTVQTDFVRGLILAIR